MKTALLLLTLLLTNTFMLTAQNSAQTKSLRHVVLFKFKESATSQDVEKVIAAFEGLPKQISQIKAFEWGVNNSPENLNEGLTHAFLLTFSSEKDRDDYLIHPDHKKFGGIVGPHIEKVVVVDYWIK
jgi:hypothetical protein